MEVSEYDKHFALDSLVGKPTGPLVYVEALGMEVPTYPERREDLYRQGIKVTLMHHVPLKMRGPYVWNDNEEFGPNGEKKNHANYCMCMGVQPEKFSNGKARPNGLNNPNAGTPCRNKAINYSGYCGWHGGALHPLDKSQPREIPRDIQFKMGKLDPRDMDDEELARGQIRLANGKWTNFKTIPHAVHDEVIKRLFERADEKLRENLMDTVNIMADIAKNPAVEPADRIKAATWIHERVRGKAPIIVEHRQDKPFEVVLGAVLEGGSRAASRAARGYEDELEAQNPLDVEFELEDDGSVEYEAVGYRDDPELRAEETAEPVFVQQHVDPAEGPRVGQSGIPQDPIARDKYEKEERAKREAFQQQIKEARAKRYSSRAKGLDHVESYPYGIEVEDMPEDGPTATAIFWTEPKPPKISAGTHAREQRRGRNVERGDI